VAGKVEVFEAGPSNEVRVHARTRIGSGFLIPLFQEKETAAAGAEE